MATLRDYISFESETRVSIEAILALLTLVTFEGMTRAKADEICMDLFMPFEGGCPEDMEALMDKAEGLSPAALTARNEFICRCRAWMTLAEGGHLQTEEDWARMDEDLARGL